MLYVSTSYCFDFLNGFKVTSFWKIYSIYYEGSNYTYVAKFTLRNAVHVNFCGCSYTIYQYSNKDCDNSVDVDLVFLALASEVEAVEFSVETVFVHVEDHNLTDKTLTRNVRNQINQTFLYFF